MLAFVISKTSFQRIEFEIFLTCLRSTSNFLIPLLFIRIKNFQLHYTGKIIKKIAFKNIHTS